MPNKKQGQQTEIIGDPLAPKQLGRWSPKSRVKEKG